MCTHLVNSIANDGTKFYLLIDKDAPQYKLVSVDLASPPGLRVFKDVIPEDQTAHLEDILAIDNDKFAVVYKRNVRVLYPCLWPSPNMFCTGQGRDIHIFHGWNPPIESCT